MIEEARGLTDYQECGTGPIVVLVVRHRKSHGDAARLNTLIEGAAHFMIARHANQVVSLIAAHLRDAETLV